MDCGTGLHRHSHLSEMVACHGHGRDQHGMKPVHFCQSIDWLGPDVCFAHLVKLDADEIALLGATGSGIASVRELETAVAAVAAVSIGVDGAASNEAADMISETHAARLIHRGRAGNAAVTLHRGDRSRDWPEMQWFECTSVE